MDMYASGLATTSQNGLGRRLSVTGTSNVPGGIGIGISFLNERPVGDVVVTSRTGLVYKSIRIYSKVCSPLSLRFKS